MRIKEIYRGNTAPKDTDLMWIRGKEILLFSNGGWVNVNESTIVDTELDPTSNHPIANSAVATSLSNVEEVTKNCTEITYSELKALRDGGNLIPGMWYRITDYECFTSQKDTRSAGHQFDILAQALDVNVLGEECKAIQHEGDTYFTSLGANLSAWKIWYCIDNDTTRFLWSDDTNGKGVIYRMIDEWQNDCPYDFKNIQFKRKLDSSGHYDPTNGIDTWVYTFSVKNQTEQLDAFMLNGSIPDSFAKGNKISEYYWEYNYRDETNLIRTDTKRALNNNVFLTSYSVTISDLVIISFNTFGVNCYDNTLEHSNNNEFGNKCYSNYLYYSDKNHFKNICRNLTLKMGCKSNIFCNDCDDNILGNNCSYNYFGNVFAHNILGQQCSENVFNNWCLNNTLGENCSSNYFGIDNCNNNFGNNCIFNTLGNHCGEIVLGNNSERNLFGNNCWTNNLPEYSIRNSFDVDVQDITISKAYVKWITIAPGNKYITLTCSGTPTNENYLQNIHIALGVNNSSTPKTITHATLGDLFQTTYQNSNSQTINV